MVREGLSAEMSFHLRAEGGKGAGDGRAAQAERSASTEAQGRDKFALLRNKKISMAGV